MSGVINPYLTDVVLDFLSDILSFFQDPHLTCQGGGRSWMRKALYCGCNSMCAGEEEN